MQWGAYRWQLTASVIIQGNKVCNSRSGGSLGKRKGGLVECNMARDDDPIARQVKTPVPFVMSGPRKRHWADRRAILCAAVAD
jgi:hypothetical protein